MKCPHSGWILEAGRGAGVERGAGCAAALRFARVLVRSLFCACRNSQQRTMLLCCRWCTCYCLVAVLRQARNGLLCTCRSGAMEEKASPAGKHKHIAAGMAAVRAMALVALVLAVVPAAAQNPGFGIALTNPGLDYLRSVLMPELEKELQTLTIPPVSGKADTPIGHVSYDLSDIKNNGISIGSSSLDIESGLVHVSITNLAAKFSAHWHYREDSFPHISDSGSADVSASGVSASVGALIGVSANHEPTIKVGSCSGSIGDLSIKFHGGASWLYNLFSSDIAGEIKKSISDQICDIITSQINNEVNKELATLPTQVPIDDYSMINFELISAPVCTSDFVFVPSKGEFFSRNNPKEAPFASPGFPTPSGNLPRMFYLWISPFLPETAAYVYEQAGLLSYTVHADVVPSSFPLQLNTSDFGLIAPEMSKKYPNMAMAIAVNATGVPPIQFKALPGNLTATISFDMTALVVLPNNTNVNAFTISVNLLTIGTAWVDNTPKSETIRGNLTLIHVGLNLANSNVGPVSVGPLQAAINLFAAAYVIPSLNKQGNKGFPIPIFSGVSLKNPAVNIQNGYVEIETDISYNPSWRREAAEKNEQLRRGRH
eukprot:m.286929 g.286929  ORF g.286929 m.286929 type:complete len:601 (-) comp11670_c0_seq1:2389-4191(-)